MADGHPRGAESELKSVLKNVSGKSIFVNRGV